MITRITRSATLLVALLAASPAPAQEASDTALAAAESFPGIGEADSRFGFLERYCLECHNADDWAGSLAFDLMAPREIPGEAETWEEVIRKLRGDLMPPTGATLRPADAEKHEFVAWLESYLDHAAALAPPRGNSGIIRRMNRKEYANAVRDLLGMEFDPAALLPRDPSVDGFDNVADALRISPSFLEQSLISARTVVAQAIGDPDSRPGGATYRVDYAGGQYAHVDGLPPGTRGGIAVEHVFPADGEYRLNIADLARAVWVFNQEFSQILIATYDGERFFEVEIGGAEDLRAIDQNGDVAVDAINARLKNIPFQAKAGPHRIAVTFVHRSFAEYEGNLHSVRPGGGQNILALGSFEVQGPFNPAGLSANSVRSTIFSCRSGDAADTEACAESIVRRFARRAFRGYATEEDIALLMADYREGAAMNGFENGVRRALTTLLASPKFLFRLERLPEGAAPGSTHPASPLELASRLSFFLWSSIPDDELLRVAESGELARSEVLEAQVRRMLRDERAASLASNFAHQWLNLGALDDIDPDPLLFADVDPGVRELFKEELRLLTAEVFLEDRSVVDLLTADFTYLNERLALHYGYHHVKGDRFRRVSLADDPARHGLLGKGGILMVSSYPDRTSPVLRGAYVLEHVMGTPPAAPPPNVEALTDNLPGQRQLTVRERLEMHRNNPSCNGCHGLMDPLGFALESFDAVGRHRPIDRFIGAPVDTSGVLPGGKRIADINDLRASLLERPEQFVLNLTENLLLFALGRPIEARDMPAVRGIVRQAAESGYRFHDLVLGIVGSPQFQLKQAAPADGTVAALAGGGRD